MNDLPSSEPKDRRQFLKTSAAVAAGSLAFPHVGRTEPIRSKIKVGLIGCGGRGTGAASQALRADDDIALTAMADVSERRLDRSLQGLTKALSGKVDCPEKNRFVGVDAFQKVIDSDIDVVLLATPPGFRPQHLAAAVEAGKHVFCEKPMAVDMPGVRSVLDSVKKSEEKGLSIVAGFCWRYHNSRRAAFELILDGAIGDVRSYYATYYTGPVKPMPPEDRRPEGMPDVAWQIRNWYNFTWTCGDSIVEQAVHSVDKIGWAMLDRPPLTVVANGGRQLPNHAGNIFDHFNVVYEYPNGMLGFLANRQIRGCFNENADFIIGSQGQCVIGKGQPYLTDLAGKELWRYDGPENDMYQEEHDWLFSNLRKGNPVNDGHRMVNSTMMAIVGRDAAYTGKKIAWEEAMKSQWDLAPDHLKWDDSFEPHKLPQPGITKYS